MEMAGWFVFVSWDFSDSDDGQKIDETLCVNLIQLLNKVVGPELMINFIRTFLLESNSTSIRWQAHSLVFHIYR